MKYLMMLFLIAGAVLAGFSSLSCTDAGFKPNYRIYKNPVTLTPSPQNPKDDPITDLRHDFR